MKRITAVLLAAAMLLLASGCQNSPASGSLGKQESSQAQTSESAPGEEISYPAEAPSAYDPLPGVPEGQAASVPGEGKSSDPAPEKPDEIKPAQNDPSEPQAADQAEQALVPQSASANQDLAPIQDQDGEALSLTKTSATKEEEVRAIWISYLDFYTLARNKSEAEFTKNIENAFSQIANFGLNTVFVQVRPFGDAMYRSEIFPWSNVLTGTEGVDPGYDPLEIMVKLAKKKGLRIEAWINPYRIRTSKKDPLSSDNPAVAYINSGNGAVIQYHNGCYYNPSSKTARNLITKGVVEIVKNYDIDGIHFDDYFYPTTDMSFDAAFYNQYKNAGGTLSQAEWRRENVNLLIKQVYAAIKDTDPDVLFGISPQANMYNNYNGQFIDVQKWIDNPGYIDYICPQVYFGFQNKTMPYAQVVEQWNQMTEGSDVDLYIGVAPYKCGYTDAYAGDGKNEWLNNADLMERMVMEARDQSAYGGFVLYRYDSIFNPAPEVASHMKQECQNLSSLLK